jgi:hypothetical protein
VTNASNDLTFDSVEPSVDTSTLRKIKIFLFRILVLTVTVVRDFALAAEHFEETRVSKTSRIKF